MTSEIYNKLRSTSPILHVDKLSIPVLLLIGKADRRVILTHGAELYHALKARNSFEAMVDWFVQATGP
jgi:acylaminoacyl-peptidase